MLAPRAYTNQSISEQTANTDVSGEQTPSAMRHRKTHTYG